MIHEKQRRMMGPRRALVFTGMLATAGLILWAYADMGTTGAVATPPTSGHVGSAVEVAVQDVKDSLVEAAPPSASRASVHIAENSGISPKREPASEPAQVVYELEVLAPDGRPAADVRVDVWEQGLADAAVSQRSDVRGICGIRGNREPGRVRLLAVQQGRYSSGVCNLGDLELSDDGAYRVILHSVGTLSGQVLAVNEAPVSGARIGLKSPMLAGAGKPVVPEDVITDTAGRFAIQLAAVPGQYSIWAEHGGNTSEILYAKVTGNEVADVLLRFSSELSIT